MEFNKRNLIIGLVVLAVAFAVGRYTVPETVKIETKTVYVEKTVKEKKTDTKTDVDKKRRTETVTTETTRPDGTRIVETRVIELVDQSKSVDKSTDTKSSTDKSVLEETSKLVESGKNKITISALGGVRISALKESPVFGGHISRPILGPITMGLWGLSNGMAGASVGLQF